MPWVKTFDTNIAIDRATQVFWAKGYESTSLADLLKATQINKGSFYNAFGSKKSLFTQSLTKYDQENRRVAITQLSALNDPIVAISHFFDMVLDESVNDKDCKGCFLINTALDSPNHDADIQAIVKTGLMELQTFFEEQVSLGISTGVIPSDKNPNAIAKSLVAQLVGLRVLARGVFDVDSLTTIKSQALNLIK
ncbi:TetR/AcrR family transcriptional regulator [Leucothrix arctica]|uniref:TetR/AcrR family transcriptional regulator n=1 Tax=Leucothrix arctica TaxID=1481894 RepID=A0A317CH69_9GAMM|nr:TetR/AcrR family transcriptional regulator [Leucothrix arctica]PWQ97888.1 TetR/AcrR family transcriptional regulator [Leucothrix arctica]